MTPLFRIEAFAERDLLHTYLKDESSNRFGTIKDRRNEQVVKEAHRLRVDKLVLITSGNNGYSLAKLAENTAMKVVCIVDRSLDQKIIQKLRSVAYQVIEINLTEKILRPEEIIAFARERDDEVIWDVTNGYEDGYTSVVIEILSEIPNVDYIVVPLGSGGIFVGVVQALERLRKDTKVIGVGPVSSYKSFADKLCTPWTPYARAIQNYVQNGHKVIRLEESAIKQAFQQHQHLATMEPSSSIVFAAVEYMDFKPEDHIVFLNSGKPTSH